MALVDIDLLPVGDLLRVRRVLRLGIRGRWFWRRSMFFGMLPCAYAASPSAKVTLHFGNAHNSHLLVPVN